MKTRSNQFLEVNYFDSFSILTSKIYITLLAKNIITMKSTWAW